MGYWPYQLAKVSIDLRYHFRMEEGHFYRYHVTYVA
eukprot:COSAG01_NODE_796_length_13536_cov_5.683635_11_plen_36_part_00